LQGCGSCNDYCRWVGNSGSGGDPAERLTHGWTTSTFKGQGSSWSCRRAGTSESNSPDGTFTSWPFAKCAASDAQAYTRHEGKHCGGASISTWASGEPAPYGRSYVGNPADCKSKCADHADCAGFVVRTEDKKCFWKKGPLNLFTMEDYHCYEKQPYIRHDGKNCGGDSISIWASGESAAYGQGGDLPGCMAKCEDHPDCAGFVVRDEDNRCSFWKKGPLNLYTMGGHHCYEKQAYTWYEGKHCGGHAISIWASGEPAAYAQGYVDDLAGCKSKCADHPDCAGFAVRRQDNRCSFWKKGPLSPYAGHHCYEKQEEVAAATTTSSGLLDVTTPASASSGLSMTQTTVTGDFQLSVADAAAVVNSPGFKAVVETGIAATARVNPADVTAQLTLSSRRLEAAFRMPRGRRLGQAIRVEYGINVDGEEMFGNIVAEAMTYSTMAELCQNIEQAVLASPDAASLGQIVGQLRVLQRSKVVVSVSTPVQEGTTTAEPWSVASRLEPREQTASPAHHSSCSLLFLLFLLAACAGLTL